MSAVRPILDKVVVKPEKSGRSSGAGIILAGNAKEQPITGRVIARGPGGMIDGREVRMYVNEGDVVLIPVNMGTKFTLGGEEYIIIRQEDILAIIS